MEPAANLRCLNLKDMSVPTIVCSSLYHLQFLGRGCVTLGRGCVKEVEILKTFVGSKIKKKLLANHCQSNIFLMIFRARIRLENIRLFNLVS
jgi:hypothetical protein